MAMPRRGTECRRGQVARDSGVFGLAWAVTTETEVACNDDISTANILEEVKLVLITTLKPGV